MLTKAQRAIKTPMPRKSEEAFDAPKRDQRSHQSSLGQFFTPSPVAELMASFFQQQPTVVELLDAGAGQGALTAALVRRLCAQDRKPERISVTAFEIDCAMIGDLQSAMSRCRHESEQAGIEFTATVKNEDFIAFAAASIRHQLFGEPPPSFNVAIANPPYRKIRSNSPARQLLHSAGIETSNLYSGFVALISRLLEKNGELVAITPRSFCNGPYFRSFRNEFLQKMSIGRVHIFESRSAAFRGDSVLQENVIVQAVKNQQRPKCIILSQSLGKSGTTLVEREVPYEDVISPNDPQQFLHLPTDEAHTRAKSILCNLTASIDELGIEVSTGRVVDFRARDFLRQNATSETVPLIYPCHFDAMRIRWPKNKSRKPNAIVRNEQTEELLIPSGNYVLVKRFSAKEERRRIVASVFDSDQSPAQVVGFENHLNYYHASGQGLKRSLAQGLAAFLNSTVTDTYFRQFSGHTQVNATDLRSLRYPDKRTLEIMGREIGDRQLTQAELDSLVTKRLS